MNNASLASELGVSENQIAHARWLLSPDEIRQLHEDLGQELFNHLLNPKRDPQVIRDVSQALGLAGNDTAARNAIAATLRLNLKGTLSNLELGH